MGVSEEIRQKLLPRFRETTADRVEKISAALLELERGQATPELSEELARELHTLKGEARMMGFAGISTVVHAAEDLLKAVTPESPGERLDALLKACDAILPMLDAPAEGGVSAQTMADRLRALIAAAPPPAAKAAAPAGDGGERPTTTGEHEAVRPDAAPLKPELGARPTGSIRVDVDRLDEIAALAGDVLVEGARSIRRSRDLNALFGRWARVSDRIIAFAETLRGATASRLLEQIEGDVHLLRSDTFRFARAQP